MRLLSRIRRRLRALTRREDAERDLDDELRFHIEMEAAKNVRAGLPAEVARREAVVAFGGIDRYKEETRDVRGVRPLEELAQDLRYGLRLLRKSPGYALVVVLTLALGVGANTAIFSVVDAVLLRPLPYGDPGRLVILYAQNPDRSIPRFSVSYADWIDWRAQNRVFTDIALVMNGTATLGGGAEPERLRVRLVTDNFFTLLRVPARTGRLFIPGEAEREGAQAVVLSHGLWTRRFGGLLDIVGQTIQLNGQARVVAGVLPARFDLLGSDADVYTILLPSAIPGVANHGQHMAQAIARLRPGVTLAQAQQDLQTVAARLAATHNDITGWSANVFGAFDEMTRTVRGPLLILLAAAALVLAIACINIASLQLTRGAARGRELAVRRALGATRGRLVAQLLVESILLACVGGVAGLALGGAATRLLVRLVPSGAVPRLESVSIDGRLLFFTLAISLATGLIVGLWPAVRASDPSVAPALRDGGGRDGRGGSSGTTPRFRRGLVVVEIALALVLVIGAGLVLQSLQRILDVDPGFRPERLMTMQLSLGRGRYPDSVQLAFYRDLVARLTSQPAIQSAAAVNVPPLSGGGIVTPIRLIGRAPSADASPIMSTVTAVTPGYFRVIGMPLLRGRDVAWSDARPTLAVNASAARRFWPNDNPIGKRVAFGARDTVGLEIVGVVADARTRQLTAEPDAVLYMLLSGASSVVRTTTVIMRSDADLASVVATAKRVLRDLDPTIPLYNVQSMQQIVAQSVATPTLDTILLTAFAGIALLLAIIGIYGVVSYSVAQRTHEMGLRMALGARTGDVLALVVREGATLGGIGVLLGLVASRLSTPVIASWLYGITPSDPTTFLGVGALLVVIALVASWIPARRATRVDPVIAMRS